jgi:hypothetical protein
MTRKREQESRRETYIEAWRLDRHTKGKIQEGECEGQTGWSLQAREHLEEYDLTQDADDKRSYYKLHMKLHRRETIL